MVLARSLAFVMAALEAATHHARVCGRKSHGSPTLARWVAGASPAMTKE